MQLGLQLDHEERATTSGREPAQVKDEVEDFAVVSEPLLRIRELVHVARRSAKKITLRSQAFQVIAGRRT